MPFEQDGRRCGVSTGPVHQMWNPMDQAPMARGRWRPRARSGPPVDQRAKGQRGVSAEPRTTGRHVRPAHTGPDCTGSAGTASTRTPEAMRSRRLSSVLVGTLVLSISLLGVADLVVRWDPT